MFSHFDLTHHCYLIEGGGAELVPRLSAFLEKEHGVAVRGNPDFWWKDFEILGVDEARSLRERASRAAVFGKKFFVISFFSITEEAQNALLKTLEDPTHGTYFFLITPSVSKLFLTILSRAMVIAPRGSDESRDAVYEKVADDFLNAAVLKRLILLKELVEEKDKQKATLFLNEIERQLAHDFQKNREDGVAEKLKHTALARKNLGAPSSSIKLIFEHLALIL